MKRMFIFALLSNRCGLNPGEEIVSTRSAGVEGGVWVLQFCPNAPLKNLKSLSNELMADLIILWLDEMLSFKFHLIICSKLSVWFPKCCSLWVKTLLRCLLYWEKRHSFKGQIMNDLYEILCFMLSGVCRIFDPWLGRAATSDFSCIKL